MKASERRALSLLLPGEAETAKLGEDLALALGRGDCLALHGDLGAGKSTLARAFLRAMADDQTLEVPSPTFTLVQQYDLRYPVAHFDLYRLSDPSELDELGFDEVLEHGIGLVEWPERADGALPDDQITLHMAFDGDGRRVEIEGPVAKLDRIERVLAIRAFLSDHGFGDARRRFLTGDASSRAYEYIYADGQPRRILMDAPRKPNGPPIRDGKPYSQIVHLAEDVYPFMAIDAMLRDKGFAAPEIIESDGESGILLIEDLGTEGILEPDGQPNADRYEASVACLARLHDTPIERDIRLPEERVHRIPDFDRVAMKMEAELLVDWHLPWSRSGEVASDEERLSYLAIWDGLIDDLADADTSIVLRDFHSPNIIWREDDTGIGKIGLIDFQDAMIGPSAYDLVSIVQDARVTIDQPLATRLMTRYLTIRAETPGFDEAAFMRSWHIMAAQRSCKLAGLWVRLMQRDQKPAYMRHMPRTLDYLQAALEHPALTPLRDWCAKARIGSVESTR